MFQVACTHCILTTKFELTFSDDVYIHKSLKCRKTCYKMIFWPEHAEDISSVYLLNQIFESVSDFFVQEISKMIWPLPIKLFVCVYLPVLLIKRLHMCCFSIDKIKNKKNFKNALRITVFGGTTGNKLYYYCFLPNNILFFLNK